MSILVPDYKLVVSAPHLQQIIDSWNLDGLTQGNVVAYRTDSPEFDPKTCYQFPPQDDSFGYVDIGYYETSEKLTAAFSLLEVRSRATELHTELHHLQPWTRMGSYFFMRLATPSEVAEIKKAVSLGYAFFNNLDTTFAIHRLDSYLDRLRVTQIDNKRLRSSL
jgi:hypothetical protein